jgi:hypothetical protein
MRQISAISLSLIIFVATITYALNISVNTNSRIEFGQGVVLTSSCDKYLTVTMTREIDAATATYYLKDFTLGDISTQLHSKRVTLSLRSNGSDSSLSTSDFYFDINSLGIEFTSPLSHNDVIDYTTLGGGAAQEVGASSITFLNVRAQDGSRILADSINTVILETSGSGGCTAPVINCATVSSACTLGSIGPGGGPVVYISPTTFRDHLNNQFKYIEAAPTYWYVSAENWLDPRTSVCSTTNVLSGTSLSRSIGYAVSNTTALINTTVNGTCVAVSTAGATRPSGIKMAAQLARDYGSSWNIPTYLELIEMCKVARFGAALAPSKSSCTDSGGSSAPSGWGITNAGYVYWQYAASSKGTLAGQIDIVSFQTGTPNPSSVSDSGSAPINNTYLVRPVRYFN